MRVVGQLLGTCMLNSIRRLPEEGETNQVTQIEWYSLSKAGETTSWSQKLSAILKHYVSLNSMFPEVSTVRGINVMGAVL